MQRYAEQYASKLGWHVFPVNQDKTPRTKHGLQDATLDVSEFHWEGANLGVATGQSHLVVIDIDGPLGLANWKAMAQDPCPTPCVVKTAKGVHLYFSDPEGLYATGHLAVNVDIRGVGGYVVVPPSVHETGATYTWLKDTFPPPPPPEWLSGLLPRHQSVEGGGSSDDPTVQLLLDHGWVIAGGNDKNIYLKRPGKTDAGHSVTWNGSVLFVHSTDAEPFAEGKGYNTQQVYSLLRGPGTQWRVETLEALWGVEDWDEFFTLLATSGISTQEHYRKAWDGRKQDFDRFIKAGERVAKAEAKEELEPAFHVEDMIALYEAWGFHFRWNQDCGDVDLNGAYFDDQDYAKLRGRIWDWQQDNKMACPEALYDPAFKIMADENPYSPLKEHLEKTKWDGKPRIAALAAHFRAEQGEDQALVERFITYWVVGSVARVYEMHQNPMLVLSGPQGCGKSYFPKWLAAGFKRYYYAGSIAPASKDCRLRRCTTWIWEVEELGATTRKTDVEELKAFVTQDENKDRKSYGRRDTIGRCVASYIGTVNTSDFLSDITGNRRFLSCALDSIDWSYAEMDVDQIWAEALATYRSGTDWQLTVAETTAQQVAAAKHLSGGVVGEFLLLFLEPGEEMECVTVAEVMQELQGYGFSPTRGHKADVTRALKSWGAQKVRRQKGKAHANYYMGVRRRRIEQSIYGVK
jgi:hypothetical protein